MRGHTQDVKALKFGPDGTLYSGSYDGTCKSWDVSSMTHLQTFCVDSDEVDVADVAGAVSRRPVQVRSGPVWSGLLAKSQ